MKLHSDLLAHYYASLFFTLYIALESFSILHTDCLQHCSKHMQLYILLRSYITYVIRIALCIRDSYHVPELRKYQRITPFSLT